MYMQVPSYLHAVHHFPYEDTDTPNEDTEIAASGPESMAAISGLRQQLLHGVGAGSNEDAYKTAVRRHWIKEGGLRIAQVPTAVGYDVHVAGPRGDALRATLRGMILFVLDTQTPLRAHEHTHTHTHTHTQEKTVMQGSGQAPRRSFPATLQRGRRIRMTSSRSKTLPGTRLSTSACLPQSRSATRLWTRSASGGR